MSSGRKAPVKPPVPAELLDASKEELETGTDELLKAIEELEIGTDELLGFTDELEMGIDKLLLDSTTEELEMETGKLAPLLPGITLELATDSLLLLLELTSPLVPTLLWLVIKLLLILKLLELETADDSLPVLELLGFALLELLGFVLLELDMKRPDELIVPLLLDPLTV